MFVSACKGHTVLLQRRPVHQDLTFTRQYIRLRAGLCAKSTAVTANTIVSPATVRFSSLSRLLKDLIVAEYFRLRSLRLEMTNDLSPLDSVAKTEISGVKRRSFISRTALIMWGACGNPTRRAGLAILMI